MHMEKHIYFLVIFFLVPYSLSAASSNETDHEALLAFQNLVTSTFLAKNWTRNTTFCSWFGVTCSSKTQRVVALALPDLQLQGTISPSLANLSFLVELNLANNFFHDSIPYGLGHLPRLQVIDIQNNRLQGSIPASLFQHRRVQIISLAFNELGGEMWNGPWIVPELRVLDLSNNTLSGRIPPSVGNATNLLNFSLSGNRISGNIPQEIGNLSRLANLSLTNNQLTGSIPATLFSISSLLAIHFGYNRLSGPLLLNEGIVSSNLELLSISDNQITGFIPSNICQLTNLKILSLSFNNITGEIPRNIGCLIKLEELYIGFNSINGPIPALLGNLSALRHLDCPANHIEGSIPPELGKLSKLTNLGLDQNYNLIGQIPESIFNISSLEVIGLAFNNLSGKIPTTMGLHLPNLRGIYFASNRLEGKIPPYLTNASMLDTLELGANLFSGTIPTNLGNLRELQVLALWNNQLTNEPSGHELGFLNSLVDCWSLRYLGVSFNPLNGILPNAIGNLSSTIEDFHFSDTHIRGLIPAGIGNLSSLTDLDFENNNLTGSIPSEVGRLKQLQGLFLTNNKLQGHIPDVVCHLSNLAELWLGYNELSGIIPECIGNLGMLQKLYLGSNKFSSQFPLSLWKMAGLLYLDVSLNFILGEVPLHIGEMKAIVELDLSGTIPLSFANLISLEYLNLSLNGLSAIMIFLLVSIWIMTRQKKGKSKDIEKLPEIKTYDLVSYHEIQRSTDNFDVSNLIGAGGSSSVYKAILSNGNVVAIKVLDLENEEACKMFDTECEVMRSVRHRNLVPVITTCSSECVRALILQYMPNGSLEKWLYKEDYHLNLLQRVTIMLDVAMAVEYLHHGYGTPIVHCDLKPANVLLDEDMVAHVGDFGISKILAISTSMAHTETLGTIGYIAPEYGSEGMVSTNGDVYSYGIMLMEVLTKRRPTDEDLGLRTWIRRAFPRTVMEVVDANLFKEEEQITYKSKICVASMIELALDCTEENPESRITMKEVVKRLEKIKNTFRET